jgi:membrane associated rhomboid family serine protease
MPFVPVHDTNPLRHIRRPWVAWTLLAVNVVVFVAAQGGYTGNANDATLFYFGLIPAAFTGAAEAGSDLPGWLTLVTSAFVHADVWHLGANMVFLWVLADNVEDALGHVRYLVFYLLCAMAAGFAVILAEPGSPHPVVGASGAVSGTIAAYVLLTPHAKMWALLFGRIPLRLSAVWVLGSWAVIQVGSLVIGRGDGVSWAAHVGGLVAGGILVVFMRRRGVPLFGPVTEPLPPPAGAPPLPLAATPAMPERSEAQWR